MASRFLVGGGTGNWNSTTNWAATSGGSSGASFPVAGDDVTLDTASGATGITVNVASACATLVASSSYTGTLTVTNTLTLTSTLTLITGMTITGAGTIALTGTATVTTGGVTIGCGLTMNGTATYTLVDSFAVSGLLTLGGGTLTTTFSGAFTIRANAGMTQGGSQSTVANSGGLTTIRLGGTGTLTGTNNSANSQFRLNLTIDATGSTITFANLLFSFGGTGAPTLTYTAGTVVQAGSSSALNLCGTCTLVTAGVTWNKVTTTNTFTATLSNDLTATGLVTLANASSGPVLNGSNMNCGGGIRLGSSGGSVTGTTVLVVNGAGTLDGPSVSTGHIANQLTINAPGAAIVLAAGFYIDLSNINLVSAGSITNASSVAWTLNSGPIGQVITRGNIGTY